METAGDGEQLFDLDRDPYEQDNLLQSNMLTAQAGDALGNLRNEIAKLQASK